MKRIKKCRRGVTLTEMMIAIVVVTVGVVGGMGSFKYINKAITQSRLKTIAANLAQEEMEALKNKSYFQLLVTTATANSSGYSPNFVYDTGSYPPQTIVLWGQPPLTRVVNVDYVSVSGSNVTVLPYTASDPGMKKITVYVMWSDAGTAKKVQLDSYYENPSVAVLSAGFSGRVTNAAGGAGVGNALVQVMGAPRWRGYTNSSGDYSFQVSPGTYSLVCSTQGYFSQTVENLSVADGATTEQNFTLTKIATGSVSGMAYIRDHLVISQVVASTVMANGTGSDIEYVELYNPTTYTITICDPDTSHNVINLRYYGASGLGRDQDPIAFTCNMFSLSVGPGKYFLIANSAPVYVGGAAPNPSGLYANSNGSLSGGHCGATYPFDCIRAGYSGAVQIYDSAGVIDTVGWSNESIPRQPVVYEGTGKSLPLGLEGQKQLVRYTSPGTVTAGTGRAYDSNDNSSDFYYGAITQPPYCLFSWDTAMSPVTGSPASGAMVTAGDGLSAAALVSSTGYFLLTNIATGAVQGISSAWTINVTSNAVTTSSASITVTANENKDLGTMILATACTTGIVTGYVYGDGPDYYKPLGSPSIMVGGSGIIANTDSQGFYTLLLPTGTITITANYGSDNSSYQTSEAEVTAVIGSVVQAPDFHIAQGGYITGYVTSGTGALPDIVVQATNGGPVFEDTSDSTGHFYIYAATSSAAYTVTPDLDSLQSHSSEPTDPLTASMTTAGSVVECGTITVSGAMGTIAGTVTDGGTAITTGVLVVVSTDDVNDPLPAVDASAAPSQTVIYSVSSQADGTYSLDVRAVAGVTYKMRAFYPVVDTKTGAVSYTTKTEDDVPVTAGAVTPRNFIWP